GGAGGGGAWGGGHARVGQGVVRARAVQRRLDGPPAKPVSRRGAAPPGLRSEELATSDEGRRCLKGAPEASGETQPVSRRGAAPPGLRSEELATSDEGRRGLKGAPEASGETQPVSRRGAAPISRPPAPWSRG